MKTLARVDVSKHIHAYPSKTRGNLTSIRYVIVVRKRYRLFFNDEIFSSRTFVLKFFDNVSKMYFKMEMFVLAINVPMVAHVSRITAVRNVTAQKDSPEIIVKRKVQLVDINDRNL